MSRLLLDRVTLTPGLGLVAAFPELSDLVDRPALLRLLVAEGKEAAAEKWAAGLARQDQVRGGAGRGVGFGLGRGWGSVCVLPLRLLELLCPRAAHPSQFKDTHHCLASHKQSCALPSRTHTAPCRRRRSCTSRSALTPTASSPRPEPHACSVCARWAG